MTVAKRPLQRDLFLAGDFEGFHQAVSPCPIQQIWILRACCPATPCPSRWRYLLVFSEPGCTFALEDRLVPEEHEDPFWGSLFPRSPLSHRRARNVNSSIAAVVVNDLTVKAGGWWWLRVRSASTIRLKHSSPMCCHSMLSRLILLTTL